MLVKEEIIHVIKKVSKGHKLMFSKSKRYDKTSTWKLDNSSSRVFVKFPVSEENPEQNHCYTYFSFPEQKDDLFVYSYDSSNVLNIICYNRRFEIKNPDGITEQKDISEFYQNDLTESDRKIVDEFLINRNLRNEFSQLRSDIENRTKTKTKEVVQ